MPVTELQRGRNRRSRTAIAFCMVSAAGLVGAGGVAFAKPSWTGTTQVTIRVETGVPERSDPPLVRKPRPSATPVPSKTPSRAAISKSPTPPESPSPSAAQPRESISGSPDPSATPDGPAPTG